MCGIAGVLNKSGPLSDWQIRSLSLVSEHMAMRGPDDDGLWIEKSSRCGLAHRRLSILDLSALGHQPMIDASSGNAITFNGEIYNYRELRTELEAAGIGFISDTDTEVILKGYLLWGESLLSRLRGMFAFGIWDAARKSLWLARDPFGIKPLYYLDSPSIFAFSSQAKSLALTLQQGTSPDPSALVGFLIFGSVPEPFTIFEGIRPLPAGTSIRCSGEKIGKPIRYADPARVWLEADNSPVEVTDEELTEILRNALKSTVAAHQIADVPIGSFLSSGIDSSTLSALLAEITDKKLSTVTLRFKEFFNTELDEAEIAVKFAMARNFDHHSNEVSDAEIETELPKFFAAMDQPTIDGFNTWMVSKKAKEVGLKVCVSGIGGDELFGSYPVFSEVPVWKQKRSKLESYYGLSALVQQGLKLGAKCGLLHAKAPSVLEGENSLKNLYLTKKAIFLPPDLLHLLGSQKTEQALERLAWEFSVPDLNDFRTDHGALLALETKLFLGNQLLRDSDWASMSHSLELRVPLVDFTLLRELAPLLVNRRPSRRTKTLLCKVPQEPLPVEIMNRPKTGFETPLQRVLFVESKGKFPTSNSANVGQQYTLTKKYSLQIVDAFFPGAFAP